MCNSKTACLGIVVSAKGDKLNPEVEPIFKFSASNL